jgi:hypothetical protein
MKIHQSRTISGSGWNDPIKEEMTMKRRLVGIGLAVTVALSTFCLPIRGYAINFFTDEATWAAAVQSFGQTAPVNIAGPPNSLANLATLSAGSPLLLPFNEDLEFGIPLQAHQVPSTWATWSAGYPPENGTPRVLYTLGADSLTGTFTPTGDSVIAFGLSVEPEQAFVFSVVLTTTDGGTHTLTQLVNGNGGAQFFGWTGADVTSITVTCSAGCNGFAIGELVKGDFAGTQGKANCHGQSISALAKAFGGIDDAAADLGYPTVSALQDAVKAFCGS